ncbi:MAG: endonuclease/exonuclease/phosphatase family protein [Bacteroidales bacterium]|nr:endonuclease/exonuclease/phosphatase family protein [Bacteroidales bacterium]
MFYNVENFFDTQNDPSTNDNDFMPEGKMHWTRARYIAKRDGIFRVIAGVGEWEPPDMIGLCETENRKVLEDLLTNTPLSKYPYRIVHRESPDQRGIDVAFLYRSDRLRCIKQEFIRVRFPDNRRRTRDIAHAVLITGSNDTLYVFINHWPSRVGGQRQSDPARTLAATLLRNKVDSIFSVRPRANIIIAGDLNDRPQDNSVRRHLNALTDTAQSKPKNLFNLSAYRESEITGTIKYRGKWSVFDQIIVSGNLLHTGNRLRTSADDCHIFRAPYLLEPDTRYLGFMPFRMYIGQKFNKGFSDHLPVFLDIWTTTNKR